MNQRQKCKDEDGALKDNRINRTVLIKCDCVNLWGQTLKTILLLWQAAKRRIGTTGKGTHYVLKGRQRGNNMSH
ncbi:MAG: hypothetical protein A2W77_06435 [Nitrospinae bacterium RIFCSPLOWO2_12_39_16]|nr:MAG: hypothetical protein A2W77_06435 [Nitrospinae bacterium RIFCSPLOWO2_12_39_16]